MEAVKKTAKLVQMLVVLVILVSSEVLKDEDSDGTGPDEVPEEYRCVPGKTFRMECNSCVCFGDGDMRNAGCTRRLCPPGSWRRR
ncbi:pacifastin-like protease inhibitor cvp4 isoform X2 [Schistocerca gregaria]|uniref:pacifastin-like protease inhibitor cvp4 isoform X2 n=1 Tax=Schistocerca gregaria TaxID=7010 RepID=UPI00211ED4BC|nr:pacifastin-like protease inhibitor cvp4 isoform X2 [Schistocerca gregaria]